MKKIGLKISLSIKVSAMFVFIRYCLSVLRSKNSKRSLYCNFDIIKLFYLTMELFENLKINFVPIFFIYRKFIILVRNKGKGDILLKGN